MINLLGAKGHTGTAKYEGLNDLLNHPNVFPHLYGKESTKPFRKMGHITIIGSTIKEVKETAEKIKGIVQVTA
jgi:5-(carboxyamino)imidazole ribonucleotide synthase